MLSCRCAHYCKPRFLTPVSPIKVVLLSATIPVDVLEVTKKFMRDPIRILVKKEELSLEGIRQFYINVQKEVQGRKPKMIHVFIPCSR